MKTEPSVASQLAALPSLPMAELWKLWDAHFPRRPGTWNRDYVASRIAYKIQEIAFGGIDPDIKRRLLRIGESQSALGKRRGKERHLMPGTVLMRDWDEKTYRVVVTPAGMYETGGKVFKSLTAAVRHITGTKWSGPRFFGLDDKPREKGARA